MSAQPVRLPVNLTQRWEVTSVSEAQVNQYMRLGWEPLNASTYTGHTFDGRPIPRTVWHLRREVK